MFNIDIDCFHFVIVHDNNRSGLLISFDILVSGTGIFARLLLILW